MSITPSPQTLRWTDIVAMQEQIELLTEENLQLKAWLAPSFEIPMALRLTRYEARVLRCLIDRAPYVSSNERLSAAVYEFGEQNDNSVKVLICKLRKKLRPFGISIETAFGSGHRMTAVDVAKIKRLADEP